MPITKKVERKIKWTKEKCQEIAIKYNNKTSFRTHDNNAYSYAYRTEILDIVCSHMKKNNIWNKEKCQEKAKKYNNKSSFRTHDNNAYNSAYRNGWLDEICAHMENNYVKHTKKSCSTDAKKYKNKSDFSKNSYNSYIYAVNKKWIDEICTHMENKLTYWTFETCKNEAFKYNSRSSFAKNSGSAYNSALRNKWLEKISTHMTTPKYNTKRCIYAHEFPDKHVYIGLTNNFRTRKNNHKNYKNSSVYKYKKETGLTQEIIKLTDYLETNTAQKQEQLYIDKYKNDGWFLLNKIKAGGLGGNCLMWTKDKVINESKLYKTRTQFHKNSKGAYESARKNKWLDELFPDSINKNTPKPQFFWTKEECEKEAKKHINKTNFTKKANGAYKAALRNNWLDEFFNN